jgi:hypothetical protein
MSARWSDEFLDSKRQITDPQADAVVDAVLGEGGDQVQFNALLQGLVSNADPASAAFPEVARQYFADTRKLPQWADLEKIRQGENFFGRFSPEVILLLMCKSLPQSYAAANATKVLYNTQLLEDDVYRRIIETAQFVLDVMAPGGLNPANEAGHGIRTAQKVRLLHASIRHILRQRQDPPWEAEEWGEPINQEDLAGTLLSFSYLNLDGLKRLGTSLTTEEEETYLHCWNAVGHIMGVDEDMMVWTMAEADELWNRMDERQFRPSDSGMALTKAIINFMEHIVPGTLFDGFPSAMIRHLVGERIADMINVPHNLKIKLEEAFISGPLEHMLGDIDAAEDKHSKATKLITKFNQHLLNGIFMTVQLGKGVQFRIPDSLAQNERWREVVAPTPIHIHLTPKIGKWRLVLEKNVD